MLNPTELDASKPNFQALFESAPGLYLVLVPNPPQFTIIAVNNAYLSATMTKREIILGKGIFEVFPDNPDEVDATGVRNLRASLENVVRNIVPDTMALQKYDVRRPLEEGGGFEEKYWSPINCPVLGKDNKLLYIIHRVEDVTEFVHLKQKGMAEENLSRELRIQTQKMESELYIRAQERRQMEERYRTLTAMVPVGIFHTDASGKCLYVNESFVKLTKQSFDKVKDKIWISILHPQDQSKIFELWGQSIANNRSYRGEFRYLLPDDKVVWAIGELTAELDDQKVIKGYVGTITDISERKELERLHDIEQIEREQRLRAQQAEEYREKQKEFIDTICHELRTPLNIIFGMSDLLQESIKRMELQMNPASTRGDILKENLFSLIKDQKDGIASISQCARHQKDIVDNVLDLSKIDVHKMELHLVAFDPNHTITSIIQMFKSQLQERSLSIAFHSSDKDILVKGDPSRFSQIVINLLSNAIKYTYIGGITITLKLHEKTSTHTQLYIEVVDTGLGMTPDEQAKIFERFSQATPSMQTKYGGFGLGLVISKSLVDLMGGKIWVESEKGKGSKFAFTVVCENLLDQEKKQLKQEYEKENLRDSKELPLQSKNILIVEDNVLNQKVLQRQLEQGGHHFQIAEDGEQAVALWEKSIIEKKSSFDIILMDIVMPKKNGLEATREIREKENKMSILHVPIIGLSGNAREEHAEEGKKIGMNDYLTKPYHKDELYRRIKKCIDDQLSAIQTIVKPEANIQVSCENVAQTPKKARNNSEAEILAKLSIITQATVTTALDAQFAKAISVILEGKHPFILQQLCTNIILQLPIKEPNYTRTFCTNILEKLLQELDKIRNELNVGCLSIVNDMLILITSNENQAKYVKEYLCRIGLGNRSEIIKTPTSNIKLT